MAETIILIGFMGAGKTSVGRALERRTGLPLLDTDQLIEEQAGMTISDIFAKKGEEEFRRAETEMLKKLAGREAAGIVSTGGGLPLREENRRALTRLGTVVYLRVQPGTVCRRLAGDNTRPLLAGDGGKERVQELMTARDPLYREAADLIIDTDGLTPSAIAEKIQQKMVENSNIIV